MDAVDIQTVDAVVRWITSLAGAFLLPVLAVAILSYLERSKEAPERLARLLRPFRSFKFFGQEFVLADPAEVTASAEKTLRAYRADTTAKYNALAAQYGIEALHRQLIERVLASHIGGLNNAADFRSTIHVRDILFAESYYQLIPYFPKGGGEGRSWSIRYGIVGRTWRHDESTWEGNLKMSHANLIDEWGMTQEEAAEAKSKRPSLMAIVLRDGTGRTVGILFADSTAENAFGDEASAPDVVRSMEDGAVDIGLTAALAAIVNALPSEPLIPMLSRAKRS